MALLDDVQWLDFTDTEQGFPRLLAALQAAGLDPTESFAWDPRRSPYPGLAAFSAEDAAVFFGRERKIAQLLERLQPTLTRGRGRFVALVGPSGSGKSSIMRAGLLPRLSRHNACWIVVPPFVPESRPTHNLAHSLSRAFRDHGSARPPDSILKELERGSSGLLTAVNELAELVHDRDGPVKVLIVIDQAEELLTRAGEREQHAFLDRLTEALDEDGPLWALATVRSEFLSNAPDRAGLDAAIDDLVLVEPLSRARLAEVIVRPARRAGLDFAPGLVERMVEETVGGDALPLLAYTLQELYNRSGDHQEVTAADYDAVGGVVGALRCRADQVAGDLDRAGYGALTLSTLTKLATVSPAPTRRSVCGTFPRERPTDRR